MGVIYVCLQVTKDDFAAYLLEKKAPLPRCIVGITLVHSLDCLEHTMQIHMDSTRESDTTINGQQGSIMNVPFVNALPGWAAQSQARCPSQAHNDTGCTRRSEIRLFLAVSRKEGDKGRWVRRVSTDGYGQADGSRWVLTGGRCIHKGTYRYRR